MRFWPVFRSCGASSRGTLVNARVDQLENFPELGRVVPERNQPNIREIIVKNYRIVYRVDQTKKAVEILRVWHGARGEPEI